MEYLIIHSFRMMRYSNVFQKLVHDVQNFSKLLVLGGLAGGLYAGQEMRQIDQTDASLIIGPSVATLQAAHANRAIVSTVAAAHQHITAACTTCHLNM